MSPGTEVFSPAQLEQVTNVEVDTLSYLGRAGHSYAGYYLEGFRQNRSRFGYRMQWLPSCNHPVVDALGDPQWQPILFAMSLFRLRRGGRTLWICIDGHDSNTTVHPPLLEHVDFYFKVNYSTARLTAHPQAQHHLGKIRPLTPGFPIRAAALLPLAGRLLQGGLAADLRDYVKMFVRYGYRYRDYRDTLACGKDPQERDLDLFFVTTWYEGQHEHTNRFRYDIINGIRKQNGGHGLVGLSGRGDSSRPPAPYDTALVPRFTYTEYLQTIGRSRVGVYTRGVHECWSSRFPLFLALGLAVAGQRAVNDSADLYELDFIREQFAHDDPGLIADQAVSLAGNRDRSLELSVLNRQLFDQRYAPATATAHLLQQTGYA